MYDPSMITPDDREPRRVGLRFSSWFFWSMSLMFTIAVPVTCGAYGIASAAHLDRLRLEGVDTVGTVDQTWQETRHNKNNSWVVVMVRYSYEAEGARYQGVVEVPEGEGRGLPVGTRFAVVYQPGNPADHLRQRPTEEGVRATLWGFGAASAFFGTLALAITIWITSSQSRYLTLARFGQETTGTIVSWSKVKNGATMAYVFRVGDQLFQKDSVSLDSAAVGRVKATAGGKASVPVGKRTGWAAFFMGQPDEPMISRTLPVLYDPMNPKRSMPVATIEAVVWFLPNEDA